MTDHEGLVLQFRNKTTKIPVGKVQYMSVTRIITDLAEARETVRKRKPLGSEEMPAPVAARIQEVFGAALTPSEVVDRILADVQAEGDAALGRYLKHFDGVAPKPLEVSREEIEAALSEVDDTLLDVLRQAEERIAAYSEVERIVLIDLVCWVSIYDQVDNFAYTTGLGGFHQRLDLQIDYEGLYFQE